jgi:hypothetical protein
VKNAHERFGWLEFEKQLRDTRTRIRVALNQFIGEAADDKEACGACHLVSVFGSDVDIGAIWAAIAGQEWFTISRPEASERRVTLGKDPRIFRGTIAIAGRSRSVRHLVALSAQLAEDTDVGRTILCRDNPEFVLYQISQRLGLPVHPSWAGWFWTALQEKGRIQPLDGLGYRPIAVVGSKEEFLEWIGAAVKARSVIFPEEAGLIPWGPLDLVSIS